MLDYGYIDEGEGTGESLTEEQEKLLDNVSELKTGYYGKEYPTPQERFLDEYSMATSGNDLPIYMPYSGNKSYSIENTIEGKTRGMILEGETIKDEETGVITSIGQDENKISILSSGKNLFNLNTFICDKNKRYYSIIDGMLQIKELDTRAEYIAFENKIKVNRNTNYTLSSSINNYRVWGYNTCRFLIHQASVNTFNSGDNDYIDIKFISEEIILVSDIQIEEGTVATSYEPYKQDKKDILLPFSDGLKAIGDIKDTIDSTTNKITQRVKIALFNGSENWSTWSGTPSDTEFSYFVLDNYLLGRELTNNKAIVNKFEMLDVADTTKEMLSIRKTGDYDRIYVSIKKTSASDVNSFKSLLESWSSEGDPLVIYYKLETPIKYDLNQDLNLTTFEGRTHVTTEATSSFEAPIKIVATIESLSTQNTKLKSRVSTLENETSQLQDAVNTQEEVINYNLLATTELYEAIEPPIEVALALDPNNENIKEVKSKMVEVYAILILKGLKTIEQVPIKLRPQVEAMLEELQK